MGGGGDVIDSIDVPARKVGASACKRVESFGEGGGFSCRESPRFMPVEQHWDDHSLEDVGFQLEADALAAPEFGECVEALSGFCCSIVDVGDVGAAGVEYVAEVLVLRRLAYNVAVDHEGWLRGETHAVFEILGGAFVVPHWSSGQWVGWPEVLRGSNVDDEFDGVESVTAAYVAQK